MSVDEEKKDSSPQISKNTLTPVARECYSILATIGGLTNVRGGSPPEEGEIRIFFDQLKAQSDDYRQEAGGFFRAFQGSIGENIYNQAERIDRLAKVLEKIPTITKPEDRVWVQAATTIHFDMAANNDPWLTKFRDIVLEKLGGGENFRLSDLERFTASDFRHSIYENMANYSKGVEIAKWKEFVFIMTQAPKEVAAST